jgi:colicin import membrane protein
LAEEWISDEYAVNKKRTKLYPISGKFRRKTIDRKDFIFNKFETLLNEKQ